MKEKLIIKNFGPINSIELDLGRFNVLIGEQATGKSTVAKLLAVCRYFSYIAGNQSIALEENSSFYGGLLAWGLHGSLRDDSYIFYLCKHYSLTVSRELIKLKGQDDENNEIELEELAIRVNLQPASSEFTALLDELKKLRPNQFEQLTSGQEWRIPYSFFQIDVARVMDYPFYLPAERGLQSIFSLGKSSIHNISDALFNQLAQIDSFARQFKEDTSIEPLGIIYKNVDGQGYVRKKEEDKFLSLFYGASGYQSTIPVVLLIRYYNEFRKKNKTFIVEEPELNLFPAAQNNLMQFLVAQIMNYGNSLLLTTHSPYVLTSINNLMYAFQVGNTKNAPINQIVDQNYWLNPEDVSAYRLMKDGTAKNILDEELKQINAGELDEISGKINKIWDAIADIEFDKYDEN